MKNIKIIITALALVLSAALMAQADQHKGEATTPAAGTAVHTTDHSHDAQAAPATGTAVRTADHSHDAAPQQHTTTTAAPAAKPSGASHAYQAPAGREASGQKAHAAHPAHSGPTALQHGQGSDAAHQHAAPARAPHTGATPVRRTAGQADHAGAATSK